MGLILFMYLILKKGLLREILDKAFLKAGNIRKLAKDVGIPRSTLSSYHMEKVSITEKNLNKLLRYLLMTLTKGGIVKKFPDNWRQIKGGKKCVEIKKKKGIFEKQLKKMRSKNSYEHIKLWHKRMKKENPEKYYQMQYEKFKKIGGYKFLTLDGKKVRNQFEKDVADLLKGLGLDYKYEPLVYVGKKYFFPDFLINDKIILECTE